MKSAAALVTWSKLIRVAQVMPSSEVSNYRTDDEPGGVLYGWEHPDLDLYSAVLDGELA